MEKNKAIRVLSTSAMTALMTAALGSTAFAKTTAILTKDSQGNYLRYSYQDLVTSFMADPGSKDRNLYDDFKAKSASTVAYYDDKTGYVDINYIGQQYLAQKSNFKLDTVTEAATSSSIIATPAVVTPRVVNSDGTVGNGTPTNAKTVTSVAAISNLTVANGTTADKIGLPSTVALTLSDSTTANANITWNTTGFDGTVAGDKTITGTLTAPDGVVLTDAQKSVSVKVTVQAAGLAVSSVNAINSSLASVSLTSVPVNASFKVVFSKALDSTTVNANTIYVTNSSGARVSATLTYSSTDNSVLVTPTVNLAQAGNYNLVVTTGVKTSDGNPLVSQNTTSITTSAAPDIMGVREIPHAATPVYTGGTVLSGSSVTGSLGNTNDIVVGFTEAMDTSTLTTSNIKLYNVTDGVYIPVTVTANDQTSAANMCVSLRAAANLTANKQYKVIVTTGVKDLAGNALQYQYENTIATAAAALDVDTTSTVRVGDVTTPAVTGNTAMTSATTKINPRLTVNTGSFPISIYVPFTSALDATTLTDTNVYLTVSGSSTHIPVTLSTTNAGTSLVVTPKADLSEKTTYVLTMTTGVKNSIGIPVGAQRTVTFTTGDFTAPTITASTPANNATGVLGTDGGTFTVNFSEAMDTSKLVLSNNTGGVKYGNTANGSIALYNVSTSSYVDMTAAGWSQSYDATNNILTIRHPQLTNGQTYILYFKSTITDTATAADGATATATTKNILGTENTISFTIANADTTPPVISSYKLANYDATGTAITTGKTLVSVNSLVYAVFNKPMDLSTLTPNTSVKLQKLNNGNWADVTLNGGGNIAYTEGNVGTQYGYVGIDASGNNFTADTRYRIVLTTDAKDSSSNAMAAQQTFEFVTGTAPALSLTASSPAAYDTNVSSTVPYLAVILDDANSDLALSTLNSTNIAVTKVSDGSAAPFTFAYANSSKPGPEIITTDDTGTPDETNLTTIAVKGDQVSNLSVGNIITINGINKAFVVTAIPNATHITLDRAVGTNLGGDTAITRHQGVVLALNSGARLDGNAIYSVGINNVTDVIGNPMANTTLQFQTANTTAPKISSINVADNAFAVDATGDFTVKFDSVMLADGSANAVNKLTGAQGDNVYVQNISTGAKVDAVYNYDSTTNTLKITPYTLSNNTGYRLVVKSSVLGANGVAMGGTDNTRTFSTDNTVAKIASAQFNSTTSMLSITFSNPISIVGGTADVNSLNLPAYVTGAAGFTATQATLSADKQTLTFFLNNTAGKVSIVNGDTLSIKGIATPSTKEIQALSGTIGATGVAYGAAGVDGDANSGSSVTITVN